MRILVTGSDGYIGCVLVSYLAQAGHDVVGLDAGYYRAGLLYEDGEDRPPVWSMDIRRVRPADLVGFEAVVHLAELSNDPLCAHRPAITFDVNHRGSMSLAGAAKAAGVLRFVYASSCSVYGVGGNDIKAEESEPQPLTAYAQCKALCEQELRGALRRAFRHDMLAERHGVRGVSAHAVRYCAKQSRRARLDEQGDRHDERRNTLASACPYP